MCSPILIDYKSKIAELIAENLEDLSVEEVREMIEVPGKADMGDYAFPCFKLAKILRKAPNMIAGDIKNAIEANDIFERVEQVNAYVNMFLSKEIFIKQVLGDALAKGERYGFRDLSKGKKVTIDYSSPNIAKPFHIGHLRSTGIGNSIYKIYNSLGYDVIRINHCSYLFLFIGFSRGVHYSPHRYYNL